MLRLGVQAGTSSPSPVGHNSPRFPLEKLLSGPLLSIALNPLGTQLLPHAPQGLCTASAAVGLGCVQVFLIILEFPLRPINLVMIPSPFLYT